MDYVSQINKRASGTERSVCRNKGESPVSASVKQAGAFGDDMMEVHITNREERKDEDDSEADG